MKTQLTYIKSLDEIEFDITEEDLKKAQAIYRNNPNVYIKTVGNDKAITLEEYNKTVKIVSDIANRIKSYNLSPIEQFMYAYDVVRDRLYIEESPEEDATISRDLTSVLLGDKIVCVGYARLLNAILRQCNQSISLFYIKKANDSGHAYNIAYIKDEKYDIEGIYYFDATADRKTQEKSKTFLEKYAYFALTDEELKDKYSYDIASLFNIDIEKYIDILKYNDLETMSFDKKPGYETMVIITNLIGIHSLLTNKEIKKGYTLGEINEYLSSTTSEKTIQELKRYQSLINRTIPLETFISALYNVRKIEFYESPDKYNFSVEQMTNTVWNSDNDNRNYTNILDYFDPPETQKVILSAAINGNIEQKISQIHLTKVLQKVVQQKTKEKS